MHKIITIITLIGLLSCNNNEPQNISLEGLWVDNFYYYVYFHEGKCLIDRPKMLDYTLSEGKINVVESSKKIKTYEFEFDKDTLRLKDTTKEHSRNCTKTTVKNSLEIKELYYTQVSDFTDFSCFIDGNNYYILDVAYHLKFETKRYSGTISQDYKDLLLAVIHQMDMNIEPELDSVIVSDIPEWGAKFVDKTGKEYKLYHNYLGMNKDHDTFQVLMSYFPNFVELENGVFDNELEEIEFFRKNEFKRNIKENKER